MFATKLIPKQLIAVLLLWPVAVCAQIPPDSLGAEPRSRASEVESETESVSIFFATNRARLQGGEAVGFGGERGVPLLGSCTLEFRPIPIVSEVAQRVPFFIPSETSDLSISVESDPEVYWDRLTAAVESTSSRDVVVFVHGYSYEFDRGCGRAAETQRMLHGKATVLMFTWPSNGQATDYVSDQTDLEWSVPYLQRVLEQLAGRFGPTHVHVLSHSLGSRGIILALEGAKPLRCGRPLIGHLVLLAPDFDSQTFVELLPGLVPLTDGITLYASSNDTPLKISYQLNGSPRLGQAGEFLTVVAGMETVDVTPAGRHQILGHEYFYFHPTVGADLLELLTTRRGAADRSALRPKWLEGRPYWEVVDEDQR